jgi:hypothetical protein
MTSILKVDQIQTAAGGVPTIGDLAINDTGTILQVKQTVFSGTQSTSIGPGFTEITGLQTTITPKSTSSKIMVKAALCIGAQYWQNRGRILRGGTPIGLGNAAGNRTRVTWNQINYDGSADTKYIMEHVALEYLDSPSTTSATTYSLDFGGYSTSYTVYINRNHNWTDGSFYPGTPISTLTLYEIAG